MQVGGVGSRGDRRSWRWIPLLVVALTVAAGIAGAASLTFTHNGTIRANGTYDATTDLSPWWNEAQLTTSAIPATVPPLASSVVGTPTVLPTTGANYTINAGTAGKPALEWVYQETPSAPNSTELELTFNLSLSDTVTVQILIYLETATSPPATNVTVRLYYDLPALTLTESIVQSIAEESELCTAVGTCP